jgi:hypothetical protein
LHTFCCFVIIFGVSVEVKTLKIKPYKMAQALINAQHQVNLATLPAFSKNVKEDQYSPAQ